MSKRPVEPELTDTEGVPRLPKPPAASQKGTKPLDCSNFRLRLPALKSGQVSDDRAKAEMIGHAKRCESCGKLYKAQP